MQHSRYHTHCLLVGEYINKSKTIGVGHNWSIVLPQLTLRICVVVLLDFIMAQFLKLGISPFLLDCIYSSLFQQKVVQVWQLDI